MQTRNDKIVEILWSIGAWGSLLLLISFFWFTSRAENQNNEKNTKKAATTNYINHLNNHLERATQGLMAINALDFKNNSPSEMAEHVGSAAIIANVSATNMRNLNTDNVEPEAIEICFTAINLLQKFADFFLRCKHFCKVVADYEKESKLDVLVLETAIRGVLGNDWHGKFNDTIDNHKVLRQAQNEITRKFLDLNSETSKTLSDLHRKEVRLRQFYSE